MDINENKKSAFGKNGMFNEAHPILFGRAKELRNKMTDAENVVWSHVRKGIEGCKFRRQHPIGIYIVDFYCHKVKLVVEVDGSIHDNSIVHEHDVVRQRELESWGYTVIRATNDEVFKSIDMVITTIREKVIFIKNKQII